MEAAAREKIFDSQSLRDTLTLMRITKKFFKLEEKSKGDVY